MKKIIIISTGDPAGIGPEITLKAISHLYGNISAMIIPVGEPESILEAAGIFNFPFKLTPVRTVEEAKIQTPDSIPFISVPSEGRIIKKKQPSKESGDTTLSILKQSTEICLLDPALYALVTGPINKISLAHAGWEKVGHTEILKIWTGSDSVETVFCLEQLKVFFLSRHMSLSNAISYMSQEKLIKSICKIDFFMNKLGVENPRIGIPGLNPHCGEEGLFGDEEERIIKPAIKEANEMGIKATGPIGADSIFHSGLAGEFDAILSLYHDQGHIALKTRDFFGTVTMTLGLPFLRTSVDHGTGYDIAWKGIANEKSLIKAVYLAESHL